jgi:hypothetical protein
MPFSQSVRIDLLFRAGRRCCLCWVFCGFKIDVHHIVPESEGGTDDEDNGIPLCLNCHAEVRAYDDRHPIGTKYRPEELYRHRDRLFRWIEESGPIVFDAMAHQFLSMTPESLIREEAALSAPAVDLKHDARIARYFRYLRRAEQLQLNGQFAEAIGFFESAFRIADSDSDLTAYARSGNYHLRKLLLWECYLESFAASGRHEYLRAAFNMNMGANEIQQTFRRESLPDGLRCRDYFYLFLQESLFLFDDAFRDRAPPEDRLERIGHLMDLLENPHCHEREDILVKRAQAIERDMMNKLPSVLPNVRYGRDL